MALEHLLATLRHEAEDEAAGIRAAAARDAAELAARAQARIAREREDTLRETDRSERALGIAGLAEGRLAARRAMLEARQRVLARVFARLEAATMLGGTDSAGIGADVAMVLGYLGGRPSVIRCSPAIAAAARAAAADTAGITVEPDATIGGGLVATSADGTLVVRHTLASRLERLRPALAQAIVRRLDAEA